MVAKPIVASRVSCTGVEKTSTEESVILRKDRSPPKGSKMVCSLSSNRARLIRPSNLERAAHSSLEGSLRRSPGWIAARVVERMPTKRAAQRKHANLTITINLARGNPLLNT